VNRGAVIGSAGGAGRGNPFDSGFVESAPRESMLELRQGFGRCLAAWIQDCDARFRLAVTLIDRATSLLRRLLAFDVFELNFGPGKLLLQLVDTCFGNDGSGHDQFLQRL
jgi:hypothetical protein